MLLWIKTSNWAQEQYDRDFPNNTYTCGSSSNICGIVVKKSGNYLLGGYTDCILSGSTALLYFVLKQSTTNVQLILPGSSGEEFRASTLQWVILQAGHVVQVANPYASQCSTRHVAMISLIYLDYWKAKANQSDVDQFVSQVQTEVNGSLTAANQSMLAFISQYGQQLMALKNDSQSFDGEVNGQYTSFISSPDAVAVTQLNQSLKSFVSWRCGHDGFVLVEDVEQEKRTREDAVADEGLTTSAFKTTT
jgi:hypothetical protein